MNKKTHIYADLVILTLVVIIAYWQVCLSQFTIKGDAALLSVPWKKFVSDSLRSGYLPAWNPYINLGWAQGMEPSTWYYPSWVFALFGKFRLSFLHIEIGLHFILGALGMYKLLSLLKLDRWALLGGSIAYILSGFFTGNFQHLGWTYFGCWLPFFLYYLCKTTYSPSLANSFKLGICASMLMLSGYIPFTVTTFLFTCVFIVVFIIKNSVRKKYGEVKKPLVHLFISVLVFILVCSPAIYMLFINLDTMYRSGRYNDATASFGSLLPRSLVTLFLPFTSTANAEYWQGTDISMNNAFFGLISLTFVAWAFLDKTYRKISIIVGGIGLLAFFISMGPFIKPSWYIFRHLPFYEKLRFTSQFRIYFIAAGCILSAIGIHHLLRTNSLKRTGILLAILIGGLLITGATKFSNVFFKYPYSILVETQNTATIGESAGYQAIIFSVVCILFIFPVIIYRKNSILLTRWLVILNCVLLVIAVQMNFFYTGVANTRVKKIDDAFLSLPEKFASVENLTFREYRKPAIGYTWTNTGGMFHVPNTHCYHPYDSPNYGEYEKSTPEREKQAPLIYAKASYHDTLVKGCEQVTLTPYSLSFITSGIAVDSLFIQATTYPFTRLKINDHISEINVVRNQVCITDVPYNSRVQLLFLPPGLIPVTWLAIVAFCSFLAYSIVHKLKRKKGDTLD